MSSQPNLVPRIEARRELRTEQIKQFGHLITWLNDPEQIPVVAAQMSPTSSYRELATLMAHRLGQWSEETVGQLSYQEVCDKWELSQADREGLRYALGYASVGIFQPGLEAIADMHAAVPYVATRDGRPREEWLSLARQTQAFGDALARYPTFVQYAVRQYLDFIPGIMAVHPGVLHWQEGKGVTSVTPIDHLTSTAMELALRHLDVTDLAKAPACLGGMVRAAGAETTFLGSAWQAFSFVANRDFYPQLNNINPDAVPAAEPPDMRPEEHLDPLVWRAIQMLKNRSNGGG